MIVKTIQLSTLLIFLALGMSSCGSNEDERSVKEIRPGENRIADIIRNPVSAEGVQDTINVAKITFKDQMFHFGNVTEGEIVTVEFEFTNTGKIPLLIADARATCGCTVPEWPKNAIEPGEGGVIKVEFNTTGKKYEQKRPVSIIANTFPRQTDVILIGHVTPSNI